MGSLLYAGLIQDQNRGQSPLRSETAIRRRSGDPDLSSNQLLSGNKSKSRGAAGLWGGNTGSPQRQAPLFYYIFSKHSCLPSAAASTRCCCKR